MIVRASCRGSDGTGRFTDRRGTRVASATGAPDRRDIVAPRATAVDIEDVYELPSVESADAIPDLWQTPATYTLEMAVRCPHCDEAIRTIRIVGLTRSQV